LQEIALVEPGGLIMMELSLSTLPKQAVSPDFQIAARHELKVDPVGFEPQKTLCPLIGNNYENFCAFGPKR